MKQRLRVVVAGAAADGLDGAGAVEEEGAAAVVRTTGGGDGAGAGVADRFAGGVEGAVLEGRPAAGGADRDTAVPDGEGAELEA